MAVKKKCPEFENHERWLVSYADMVTLLFAVFVVLYALSNSGEKAADAAGSIEESFNKPLEDIPSTHRIGPNEQGYGIFEHFLGNSIRPPLTKKFPGQTLRPKVIEREMHQIKMMIDERLYGPQKFLKNADPGQARIISVEPTRDGFMLRLLARHFYDPGDIKVRREALGDLDFVAKMLKELGRPIVIEGHTDSLPPKRGSNWELSALRATEVLHYMIRNHNYPATKIAASGYADTRPMASNTTEQGRSLNRRIEIKIKYDDDTSVDSQ